MTPVEAPRYRTLLVAIATTLTVAGAAALLMRPKQNERSAPPAGYHEMTIADVTPAGSGYAVRLTDARRERAITVYVGQSEGTSIELRLHGEHFVRPLTADLLDAVMNELGGELERVQIDSLRGGTYYGSLHLRHDGHAVELDARPSDAMALALGHHAPILLADPVVDIAGVPLENDPY